MAADPSRRAPPPDAPRALSIEAIAAGAALSIGWGFLSGQVWRFVPYDVLTGSPWLIAMIAPLLGLIGDAAGGFLAGWLAQARGVAHGALANVLAIVGGFVLGVVLIGTNENADYSYLTTFWYWGTFLGWAAVGVALAMAAGAIAVRVRRPAA